MPERRTRRSRRVPSEGIHVAIIMDGNGRWAQARGLPRVAGHREGAAAVRRAVEEACRQGVRTLTLYAFSSDNWQRPKGEVRTLMQLFYEFLQKETQNCRKEGIRIRVIGRRDRLGLSLLSAIKAAETATKGCTSLDLRLAVDYSSRDAILRAASLAGDSVPPSRSEFALRLGAGVGISDPSQDVDLLIRTGGERRLSDFLLWECAYAELYFTDVMWPDFAERDFSEAVEAFRRRERRYGKVPEKKSGSHAS